MYARVLTLHVRLEKKPELARKILKHVLPLIKRSGLSPLSIFVLQDEVEVDKVLVVSLWETKDDAHRYQAILYERVKAILDPYLTFAPALRNYKVDESAPWSQLTHPQDAGGLLPVETQPPKIARLD
jgi:heme-degrading monooxygenase HmoA